MIMSLAMSASNDKEDTADYSQPCRFYGMKFGCKRGVDCRYVHAEGAAYKPPVQPSSSSSERRGAGGDVPSPRGGRWQASTMSALGSALRNGERHDGGGYSSSQRGGRAGADVIRGGGGRRGGLRHDYNQPCRFFNTAEGCKRGTECRFVHTKE